MLNSEIKRFLVVGFTTVFIDMLVYFVCVQLGINLDLSKGIGFITGTIFAYFANKLWTFSVSGGYKQFINFIALYTTTLAVNVGINWLILNLLGISKITYIAAFLVATTSSAILNFIGMKFIVFQTHKGL
jgi:putative flippase GtrA